MLIPFLYHEKYGFVEQTNHQPKDYQAWEKLIVIPVQFREVTVFKDGFASVSLDGETWGLIDEMGKIIADFIHTYPLEIFNKTVYVKDEDGDLKRLDGKIENVQMIEPSAYEIEQKLFEKVLLAFPSPLFNRIFQHLFEDYYWVMDDNYDKKGKDWHWGRTSGVIKLSSKEVIIPIQYERFNPFIFPNKAPFFMVGLSNMGNCKFINLKNEIIFSVENENIFHFDNRYLMVENKGECYLMDYDFNRIPDEIAKEIKGFEVMTPQGENSLLFMAGDGSVGWTDESRQNVLYQNYDACYIMLCENTDYKCLISRDGSSSCWVDSSGNEVFRYPSRKAHITFFKEHNYKIFQDECRNIYMLDADFQEIILSKSPFQRIDILNNGTHFLITHKNKKNALFDKNLKRIKMPKNKFLNCRGSFFMFSQLIEDYNILSGSFDLDGKIITPCIHLNAQHQVNNNDTNIVFKEGQHLIKCMDSKDIVLYYWTDFEHNVVYKS